MDKDNKVIAIGNPVLNPKVKELYLMKLTGDERNEEALITEVKISETDFEFGTFSKTEKQEHIFHLKNTGSNLLVVHDVVTSCSCTKVEYSKQPVRLGEELELKVVYEAENTGYFNKTLSVYCNVKSSPIRLRIKGVVE